MTKPIEIKFAPGHLYRAVTYLKALSECNDRKDNQLKESVKAIRMIHGELCRHGSITLHSTGRKEIGKEPMVYKRKLRIPE